MEPTPQRWTGDDAQGWYPHEGGALPFRAHSRFGLEPDSLPDGWRFGRVSALVVDEFGDVYVFQRGPKADPLIVFDQDGRFRRSVCGWQAGLFSEPHGLRLDRDGNLWTIDSGSHEILKLTRSGELILRLGVHGEAGADEDHFNAPTDVAFASTGEIYVADGYGNSRILKFSAEGKYISGWGVRGMAAGELHTPHSIAVGPDETVYVSDRGNDRIQIFSPDGQHLQEWRHLGAAQCICMGAYGDAWLLTYRNVQELGAYDSLAGRVMRISLDSGRILGSVECPGHWISRSVAGELLIASLTGNVFRWVPTGIEPPSD